VREVEHFVQGHRKDKGYQVTDRVRLALTCTDAAVTAALIAAAQDIAQEVLANEVTTVTGPVEDGAVALELESSKVACRLEQ